MNKKKKNTILIYTDAINMAAYRSLSPEEFKEMFMALFDYVNGKDKDESDFSSEDIYEMYKGYKDKVIANEKKYETQKRYREKNKNNV